MKRNMKRLLCGLLVLTMVLGVGYSTSAEAKVTPTKTKNMHYQQYSGYWATPMYSYMTANSNGTYSRIEYIGSKKMVYETYSSNLKKITSKKTIKLPLPLFGGFYAGKKYNFVVVGNRNPDKSDSKIVFHMIRYSKAMKKLGSASLKGANTTIAFDGGSLRMAEYGDYIYVRTAHEMYSGHQANASFCYNQKTDKITDSYTGVMNLSACGYVSHSFNQFVKVDTDGTIVNVDHGDAYPRSVVMSKYSTKAGSDRYISNCNSVNVKSYSGELGQNETNTRVGGFEISSNRYLVSYAYNEEQDILVGGDIYLGSVAKGEFSKSTLSTVKLTNYAKNKNIKEAGVPLLVKVNNDNFLIMWEVINDYGYLNGVYYVKINGSGKKVGQVKKLSKASLSDCQPIVKGKTVIWYHTGYKSKSVPTFYRLNYSTGKLTTTKVK